MSITQIGSVAAGVEAARFAGVQQSSQTASSTAVQRQNNRVAEETDLKKTEVVEESSDRAPASGAGERRLDITV
nr:hypothetical protein [uncultured Dongia sp.]